MSAEDIEYMNDYKEFPTKESALDWLDNYLSLTERNNLIKALQQEPLDKIIEQGSKVGHWIINKEYNGYETIITDCKCSVCGEKALLKESYSMDGQSIVLCPSNYCPNCGEKLINLQKKESE